VRDLSPEERRQALAALLLEKAATRGPRRFPLSFAQQRVWFAQQLRPETPFFNLTNAVRLSGVLDLPALGRSLAEIVRRHQALRAVFATVDGEPVQRVAPLAPLPLPEIDLAALAPGRSAAEARRVAGAEAGRPFDLGSGLLLRSALLRLGPGEQVLLVNLHHIAADGGSLAVLTAELAALYGEYSRGRPSPLPEPALQYTDFVLWQRERLRDDVLAGHVEHWRRRLQGISDLLLPTDFPRPRERSFRGASRPFTLPEGAGAALRALCRQEGVTVAMAALAAFQVLLGRYTGEEDIAVGSPIAGRDREDLALLIGFFSNTVIVRTDLSGAPSFRTLLARVREESLEAAAHQDLSFDRLVEELHPERDPSRHPLVQVMFNYRHQPAERIELPGLRLDTFEFETGSARFDLELIVRETAAGLAGQVLYNADLFHAATAARLGRHFTHLLAAAPADPERPVLELPLLSAAEHHQLLREWNDAAALPEEGESSVLERIAAAARRSPDALAVLCGGERLTCRGLADEVSRLAGRLRASGAGPGVRVGLHLERSVRLPVAVLAVLRTGAAFVPLDPRYPRERLKQTVEDAAPELLLCAGGSAPPWVAELAHLRVLEVGGSGAATAPLPPASRAVPEGGGPDGLAYLVYTSGTTGAPKGVAIPHRNLAGYVQSLGARLGIVPGDVYLHTASFGFSSSVRQLLLPLAHGARLVLATADEIADPLALCRRAAGEGVTVVDLVPSYAQSLVAVLERFPEEARLLGRHLRRVLTASEPLPAGLPGRWARAFGGEARFWNMLGHSETTGIAAVQRVAEGEALPVVPLGRPLPGRRIHLLDQRGLPVPLGAVGEIAIGGAGVGSGYWQRPELTARAFTPDPWGGPGERLYRTGDLGRLLPDGTLTFLGRRDQQVKVRGQRIEIAEIEACLGRCPGVSQAAVVARPGIPADTAQTGHASQTGTELAAYVVAESGGRPSAAALRRYLNERLPKAMVPRDFVFLDALPRTPTGKLDRAALPAPIRAREEPHGTSAAPASRLAARVAAVWCEVLGLPAVDLEDDLFELGGHSLLAVLLAARLREELGVEVSLRALFAQPTVARSVHEVIEQLIAEADREELAAVVREVAGLSEAEVTSRLQGGGSGRA
jgi:amino acid adenylation domain-containing protein